MKNSFWAKVRGKIQFIFPSLHFLLTFLFERKTFLFDHNIDLLDTIPMNSFFSDTFEIIMGYAITKLFSLILIILIWKLFFAIIHKVIPLRTTIIFSGIFIAGLALIFILWPDYTFFNIDDYMTYAYAIRFVPEYWHSVYTGCFYGACLMVFPHPFMINVIQWLWFVSLMGYIFHRIDVSPVMPHGLRHIVICFFVLPFIYLAVTDPYRCELYAMFSLFFFAVVIFDIIERKQRGKFQFFLIILCAAMVIIWRSEGIILGTGCIVSLYFFNYRTTFKKLIIHACIPAAAVLILYFPTYVGSEKYYGADYSFINYMGVLQKILNAKSANLSYAGAGEDLAALAEIVDIEALKEGGLDGYRRYNFANDRFDMNQSCATKEARKAMKKAYRNMVLHNPVIYFKHQANYFCDAIGFDVPYPLDGYTGNGSGYGRWSFNMWNIGIEDYYSHNSIVMWQENEKRQNLSAAIYKWFTDYSDSWEKNGILKWFNASVIVINFLIALCEFIKSIAKKRVTVFLIPATTLFAQIAAIAAVMPAPFYYYLRAYCYCVLLMILIYIPALIVIKRSESERPAT